MRFIKKIKIISFYIILYIPLLIIILSFVSIGLNIYKINNDINHSEIYQDLKKYYNSKVTEVHLNKKNNSIIASYHYKNGFNMKFKRKISFNASLKDYLIYVYGSSPIVTKLPIYDKEVLFTNMLEEKLKPINRKVRVYNFGINWMDSFGIKKMVKESVELKKPNLIVCYYSGAVDYDLAYRGTGIRKRYYLLKGGIIGEVLDLSMLDIIPGWKKLRIDVFDWFINAYIETNLINLFQKLNLIQLNFKPFKRYNSLISKKFKANFKEIRNTAEKNNVPIIFVTSIVNLKAKPYGVYNITQKYYTKAKKEKNYHKKISLLNKAKDSEIFTGDIRGKTPVYDCIRNLEDENRGIYVLDLKKKLMKEKFNFGYEYFYDYGHPRPKMNNIIAEKLYKFIDDNKLLSEY